MDQERPWAHQLSARVGERVAHYRHQAGLSAEDVAEQCTKAGLPMSRGVLTKLENGRREAVSLPAVLVLARVLRVSAADLIWPVGDAETVEIAPGQEIGTWAAVLQLAGLAQWVGRPAPVYERGLTWLYQVFYTYVDDWTLATESHRRTIAVGLRGVMADLRERGALVPDLPPEIAAAVYDGEADG